ncbi:hypothetical protein RCL1_005037 [Eukaryota sp. TZLM3-RCL]
MFILILVFSLIILHSVYTFYNSLSLSNVYVTPTLKSSNKSDDIEELTNITPSSEVVDLSVPLPVHPALALLVFLNKHRIVREKLTVRSMVFLFCKLKHGSKGPNPTPNPFLCNDCQQLLKYSFKRLDKCRFQERKSTCGQCRIHCYAPKFQGTMKEVMRSIGPRMLMYYPLYALAHLRDSFRPIP